MKHQPGDLLLLQRATVWTFLLFYWRNSGSGTK